jgi:flagellar biosynthetic protein FlhB
MSKGSEKTEKPTPKKIREARQEGQVARSQDLGAWATVLAATYMLQFTLSAGGPRMQTLFRDIAALIPAPTEAGALAILVEGAKTAAVLAGPFAVVLALAAFAASASQGGIHAATKSLKPKFSRLSPLQGFKRIMGPQAAWEAVKAVTKTSVAGYLVYRSLTTLAPLLAGAGSMPLAATLGVVGGTAMALMRDVALAGLLMGLADYAYQRRRLVKQLRMTKHEVKQEYKQAEGDPQLKGAIRSRQMAMSRNRMMSAVADADVVLVNPTHVAVAVRYQADRGAPRVVAKGAGLVAARIREEADRHRIPMVQDVPLARALHAACDLGQEIPAELFTAVAQVLAFVLALRARGSAAGTHRVPTLASARA